MFNYHVIIIALDLVIVVCSSTLLLNFFYNSLYRFLYSKFDYKTISILFSIFFTVPPIAIAMALQELVLAEERLADANNANDAEQAKHESDVRTRLIFLIIFAIAVAIALKGGKVPPIEIEVSKDVHHSSDNNDLNIKFKPTELNKLQSEPYLKSADPNVSNNNNVLVQSLASDSVSKGHGNESVETFSLKPKDEVVGSLVDVQIHNTNITEKLSRLNQPHPDWIWLKPPPIISIDNENIKLPIQNQNQSGEEMTLDPLKFTTTSLSEIDEIGNTNVTDSEMENMFQDYMDSELPEPTAIYNTSDTSSFQKVLRDESKYGPHHEWYTDKHYEQILSEMGVSHPLSSKEELPLNSAQYTTSSYLPLEQAASVDFEDDEPVLDLICYDENGREKAHISEKPNTTFSSNKNESILQDLPESKKDSNVPHKDFINKDKYGVWQKHIEDLKKRSITKFKEQTNRPERPFGPIGGKYASYKKPDFRDFNSRYKKS